MQGAQKQKVRTGRDAARIVRHIDALGDTKTAQRAERYLIRYGERAREALFTALTHENYLVRCYLPYVAVGIGAEWAMEIVRPLLTDPNEDVRYDTAMVLGRVPTPEAVELLRQVFDAEPEGVVASAATMALVKIGELSVPVLREFALSSDSRYASMGIQGLAGATREDMTTLFLELYARWEDENIRQTCLEALVENRMKVSVHLLRRMQESGTPRIIKSAYYWIAQIDKVW
jgi:hypothetical protein